jgi:hypothetical protein
LAYVQVVAAAMDAFTEAGAQVSVGDSPIAGTRALEALDDGCGRDKIEPLRRAALLAPGHERRLERLGHLTVPHDQPDHQWPDEQHGGTDDYFVRKQDFGVVAQDVHAVLPEAVRTRDNGMLAVDYEKLCALAFQAIVELKAEIEQLKSGQKP